MTTKAKLVIGALVVGGAAWWYFKGRGGSRPVCGPGATWKTVSDPSGYSPAVAESIRKWGGFCARTGFVSEPELGGEATSDVGADDGPDSYLITHPWQLME